MRFVRTALLISVLASVAAGNSTPVRDTEPVTLRERIVKIIKKITRPLDDTISVPHG
jgi:hypothetical protein